VAEGERALEIHEVADRDEHPVQLGRREVAISVGSLGECGFPGAHAARAVQQRRRVGEKRVDDLGIELPAAPHPHQVLGAA
jgi:hypothetical protein